MQKRDRKHIYALITSKAMKPQQLEGLRDDPLLLPFSYAFYHVSKNRQQLGDGDEDRGSPSLTETRLEILWILWMLSAAEFDMCY